MNHLDIYVRHLMDNHLLSEEKEFKWRQEWEEDSQAAQNEKQNSTQKPREEQKISIYNYGAKTMWRERVWVSTTAELRLILNFSFYCEDDIPMTQDK